MKTLFLNILLFCSVNCFSQERLEYGDFIQTDTSIKWAAEADAFLNLIPKIQKYSIKNFYLKKLKDSGLTVFDLNSDRYSVTKRKLSYADFKSAPLDTIINSNLSNESFAVILDEDSISNRPKHKICICDSCARSESFEIFRVKQIICYGNGQLSLKNILISPLCLKSNNRHGISNTFPVWDILFNIAFSNGAAINASKDDLLYLGEEEYYYDLNEFGLLENKNLLTPRAPQLIRLILEDYKKGKLKLFDPEKGIEIPYSKLKSWGLEKIPVVIYDTDGVGMGGTKTRYVMPERNFDSLNRFRIKQELFFDKKNEVLISNVKYVDILEPVISQSGVYLGNTARFRFYPKKK